MKAAKHWIYSDTLAEALRVMRPDGISEAAIPFFVELFRDVQRDALAEAIIRCHEVSERFVAPGQSTAQECASEIRSLRDSV